jgi:tetratricopeptide (TPR) repeat protein
MAVIDELQPIGLLFKEGRAEECIPKLQELWDRYPQPKEQDGNTFLILLYISKILVDLKRYEEAIDWALKAVRYNGTRSLGGESEMLIGKCAYAAGRTELATDMFRIAHFKSGKRIFQGEPKEYYELARKPAA